MICPKCNNEFSNRQWLNGKLKIVRNRKYCYDCSPKGEYNKRQGTDRICQRCNKPYITRSGAGQSTKICSACQVTATRQRIKAKAVEYKGGKCEVCGYDQCVRALQFHHRDRNSKSFNISAYSRSWKKVQVEIEKCLLLCANCHAEYEEREYMVGSNPAGSAVHIKGYSITLNMDKGYSRLSLQSGQTVKSPALHS